MNKSLAIEKYYRTASVVAAREGDHELAAEYQLKATEAREDRIMEEKQVQWDNDTIDLH